MTSCFIRYGTSAHGIASRSILRNDFPAEPGEYDKNMEFMIVNEISPGMHIVSCRWGAGDGRNALDLAPAESTRLTCDFRLSWSSNGGETNTFS